MSENPLGLKGIEFVEFCAKKDTFFDQMFKDFGFSKRLSKVVEGDEELVYYNQNDIHFLVNKKKSGHSAEFTKKHGPAISSMGFRVEDALKAFEGAIAKGAIEAPSEYNQYKAIYGIGDSLIYFIDNYNDSRFYENFGMFKNDKCFEIQDKGFLTIDHLTNNVYKGEMHKWSEFYKNIFGFSEVRYFDIKGAKTGLISYALQSPCKTFCIPINEGTEKKSQINEYLEEYNGPGIQHLAFLTDDILTSLDGLQSTAIETLDIDNEYYQEVFDRVPNVSEDRKKIQDLNILVDGDEEGYLLQIFTKNLIGPIFIEIIQRKNHYSFGEGNFGALFRSIERDQMKRGYLE